MFSDSAVRQQITMEPGSNTILLHMRTACSSIRTKRVGVATTVEQLLFIAWEEFLVPFGIGIETRLWLRKDGISPIKALFKLSPDVSLQDLGLIEHPQQIIYVDFKNEWNGGSRWSLYPHESCPGVARKSHLEADLTTAIIPSLQKINGAVAEAESELKRLEHVKKVELQKSSVKCGLEIKALVRKHEKEKNDLYKKHHLLLTSLETEHIEKVDDARRKLTEHKKVKREAQLKIRDMFGMHAVKIPECTTCFDPLLPPLKIFTCEEGHLICEPCKVQVVANTCVVCRSPGGQAARALAVEIMIKDIVG